MSSININNNNVAISATEYLKIAKGTNRSLTNTAAVRALDSSNIYKTTPCVLSTVLADNAHDGLSPLCLKSSTLEDDMLNNTKVLIDPYRLITDIISEVGKVFEFKDPSTVGPQAFGNAENGVFYKNCLNQTRLI